MLWVRAALALKLATGEDVPYCTFACETRCLCHMHSIQAMDDGTAALTARVLSGETIVERRRPFGGMQNELKNKIRPGTRKQRKPLIFFDF
mgnify:CR=1 FL=1